MAPARNSSKGQRLAASRCRADNLLTQIRLERVVGVLKDNNNKALLYEYESKLIQECYLEPIDLAPKREGTQGDYGL